MGDVAPRNAYGAAKAAKVAGTALVLRKPRRRRKARVKVSAAPKARAATSRTIVSGAAPSTNSAVPRETGSSSPWVTSSAPPMRRATSPPASKGGAAGSERARAAASMP